MHYQQKILPGHGQIVPIVYSFRARGIVFENRKVFLRVGEM